MFVGRCGRDVRRGEAWNETNAKVRRDETTSRVATPGGAGRGGRGDRGRGGPADTRRRRRRSAAPPATPPRTAGPPAARAGRRCGPPRAPRSTRPCAAGPAAAPRSSSRSTGTINHGNTTKVSGASCNTAAGVIELKQISNVTIIGVGSGAVFDQLGIHIRDSSNIIIQNVTVRNVKKSGSPTSNGGDAIGMESTVRNVWVDHVTLEASGGESEGYDGLFDMKDNTQYVTAVLQHPAQLRPRRPRRLQRERPRRTASSPSTTTCTRTSTPARRCCAAAIAHIYNNHYVSLTSPASTPGPAAKAKVENNYFKNSKDVLGTFYTNEARLLAGRGNIFDNVTWSSAGQRELPGRPEPDVQHHRQHPVLVQPRRGQLRAGHRPPDGRRQQGPAGCPNGSCSPQTPPPTTPADHAADRRHLRRPRPDHDDPARAGPTSASAPAPTAPARPAGPATATCATAT